MLVIGPALHDQNTSKGLVFRRYRVPLRGCRAGGQKTAAECPSATNKQPGGWQGFPKLFCQRLARRYPWAPARERRRCGEGARGAGGEPLGIVAACSHDRTWPKLLTGLKKESDCPARMETSGLIAGDLAGRLFRKQPPKRGSAERFAAGHRPVQFHEPSPRLCTPGGVFAPTGDPFPTKVMPSRH